MSRAGFCLAVLFVFPLCAEKPFEFWPGTQYEPGNQITSSTDILRYLEALAAASNRIRVFPYAESWEKRKLVYAAVGSEADLKRLPEIRTAMQRLADPRKTSEREAANLMAGAAGCRL